ncbi:MAG TPA: glycerol-3-phosphate 1-O-acyltransferase PlsY [Thermodesulfovibrionales bacterium]|nr:glycerol-3-phosphate 1-O-acyltransferase PlsY [Thermodesulfovibrionales bacterium]
MKLFLLIVLAFIIGSIPFGVIIARLKGVDLKRVGSGNIGATNVLRTMGKGPAILTLAGDVLKGTVSVALGRYFLSDPTLAGIAGLASVLGHNFSVFLGFKGGKGVATSIGVLLLFSPKVAMVTVALWLTVIVITRYSSLGALVSFGLLPLSIYFMDYSRGKLIISLLMSGLLIVRHTDNIERLIHGKETKVGKRS